MKSAACLQPRVRRGVAKTVVLISTLAIGILVGVTLVEAHDVRLDEALGALEKAAALIEASSTDPVSHQTQKTFDRHLEKALANIQDAMDHVAAAAAAVDADGSQ